MVMLSKTVTQKRKTSKTKRQSNDYVVCGAILHEIGCLSVTQSFFGLCWAPDAWSMTPHTTQLFYPMIFIISHL